MNLFRDINAERHDGRGRDARSRADPARRPPCDHARPGPGRPDVRRPGAAMMRALRYFVTEALISLLARPAGHAAVGLSRSPPRLFVLGGFLLVTSNLDRAAVAWRAAAEMSVYLRRRDHAGRTVSRSSAWSRRSPVVAAREYVSKDEALRRFQQLFPDLARRRRRICRTTRSRRRSRCGCGPRRAAADAVERPGRGRSSAQPGVADVQYDRRWLDRLASVTAGVRWVGVDPRAACWAPRPR